MSAFFSISLPADAETKATMREARSVTNSEIFMVNEGYGKR